MLTRAVLMPSSFQRSVERGAGGSGGGARTKKTKKKRSRATSNSTTGGSSDAAAAVRGEASAPPVAMQAPHEVHTPGRRVSRVSDTREDQAERDRVRNKLKRQRLTAPTVERRVPTVKWSADSKSGGSISVAPPVDESKCKKLWKIMRLNKTKEERYQFHIGRVYSVVDAGLSKVLQRFKQLSARKRTQLEEVTRYVRIPKQNIKHVVQHGLHCINNPAAGAAGSTIENQLCPKESAWSSKASYGIVASKHPDTSVYNEPEHGAEYFIGELLCLRPKTNPSLGRANRAKQFATLEDLQAAPPWDHESGAYSYEMSIGKKDVQAKCAIDSRGDIFNLTQEYFFSFSELEKTTVNSRPTQISLRSIIRVVYGDAAAAAKLSKSTVDEFAPASLAARIAASAKTKMVAVPKPVAAKVPQKEVSLKQPLRHGFISSAAAKGGIRAAPPPVAPRIASAATSVVAGFSIGKTCTHAATASYPNAKQRSNPPPPPLATENLLESTDGGTHPDPPHQCFSGRHPATFYLC